MGGAFGRREIEGVGCVEDGLVEGMGELVGAGGAFASSPSAVLLGELENGRRHLNGNLEAEADSVKTPKGDCASRCLAIVLLMALIFPNPVSGCWSRIEESCAKARQIPSWNDVGENV